MAQVHLLVPQLDWMSRTTYTSCLRPARNVEVTTLIGKVTCKECRRVERQVRKDGEHPLFYYFNQKPSGWRKVITTPESLWLFMREYTFQSREAFYGVYVDSKKLIIEFKPLSVGSTSQTVLDPGMVFKPAIELNCNCIFLAHNHPSGKAIASQSDVESTEGLIRAGEYLNIAIVDHLICCPNDYYSIREYYPHLF